MAYVKNCFLQVGYNRRFSPLVVKMRNAIGTQPISILYRINAGIIERDTWYQDEEVGGGRIIGEVCHFVDTTIFLCQALPKTVFANVVQAGLKDVPNEDNVHINIEFENGSLATISYTAFGNRQLEKELIEVMGLDLAMQLNNFRSLKIFSGSKNKGNES